MMGRLPCCDCACCTMSASAHANDMAFARVGQLVCRRRRRGARARAAARGQQQAGLLVRSVAAQPLWASL